MTSDEYIDENTQWTEILFKCKPGPLDRTPSLITPYHYRLDWQIWFAGFEPHTPNRHPWIFLFVAQLLTKHKDTIDLLDHSVATYMETQNITHIQANMYKYQFTKHWSDKNWWTRQLTQNYLPPLSLENKQFQDILQQLSWTGYNSLNNRKKKKKKSKRRRKKR